MYVLATRRNKLQVNTFLHFPQLKEVIIMANNYNTNKTSNNYTANRTTDSNHVINKTANKTTDKTANRTTDKTSSATSKNTTTNKNAKNAMDRSSNCHRS